VGPKSLILDPVGRLNGPPPEIATVRSGEVWLTNGTKLVLPSNQVGTIAAYGDTAAWLTRNGSQLSLNLTPQTLPITTDIDAVNGVVPGPGGSVMVRTEAGPLIWTRDARLLQPSQSILRTDRVVASANAVWVAGGGQVTRVDMSDLTTAIFPAEGHPQWKTVVSADPVSDRVVVTDDQGCQAVLDGSTGDPVWRTCDWEILALSPDGRLAAAQSVAYRTIDMVDVASGQLRLRIDIEHNPVSPGMLFDQQGRLNLRVEGGRVSPQFMIVAVSGDCWFSTEPFVTAQFLLPNRR
jgi:hypothetical protein